MTKAEPVFEDFGVDQSLSLSSRELTMLSDILRRVDDVATGWGTIDVWERAASDVFPWCTSEAEVGSPSPDWVALLEKIDNAKIHSYHAAEQP